MNGNFDIPVSVKGYCLPKYCLGEFESNSQGGVVYWTHKDRRSRHVVGRLGRRRNRCQLENDNTYLPSRRFHAGSFTGNPTAVCPLDALTGRPGRP